MKRSLPEVYIDVLRAIRDGADTPTKLQVRANVSWLVSQDIINDLLRNNLMAANTVGARRQFRITMEGLALVSVAEELSYRLKRVLPEQDTRPIIYAGGGK